MKSQPCQKQYPKSKKENLFAKKGNNLFGTDKLNAGLKEIGDGLKALTTAPGISEASADVALGAEKLLGIDARRNSRPDPLMAIP